MTDGIYTVANDVVYDQLVALLNSIEANAPGVPVCVLPYDDRTERIQADIATRANVTFWEDTGLFTPWEEFSRRVWSAHPTAMKTWEEQGMTGVYRIGMNRRYSAFDPNAPFEKFIYLDADTLLLNPVQLIFDKLDQADFVVYDFQFKDPLHIYNLETPRLLEIFEQSRIDTEIFCAGMFASKRGVFSPQELERLVEQLEQGDAQVLRLQAPNQSVLNYMVMRSRKTVLNLALHLPKEQTTGNAVTSRHFVTQGDGLYDKGNRLTYVHYIGLSAKLFQQLCSGENVDFPYRDIFLHYRYLHTPDERPQFTTKPRPYNAPPTFLQKVLKKVGLSR